MKRAFVFTDEFTQVLGKFHSNWSIIDVHVDYAIYKFLGVTAFQAHLITSGMVFGRKIRLLVDIIKHSDDRRKSDLLRVLGQITGANRELVTHSYIRSEPDSVTFLTRISSGTFTAKERTFTRDEFIALSQELYEAGIEFRRLLGATREELDAFAKAALRANRS